RGTRRTAGRSAHRDRCVSRSHFRRARRALVGARPVNAPVRGCSSGPVQLRRRWTLHCASRFQRRGAAGRTREWPDLVQRRRPRRNAVWGTTGLGSHSPIARAITTEYGPSLVLMGERNGHGHALLTASSVAL